MEDQILLSHFCQNQGDVLLGGHVELRTPTAQQTFYAWVHEIAEDKVQYRYLSTCMMAWRALP